MDERKRSVWFRAGVLLLGSAILMFVWAFWLQSSLYYWDVVGDEDVWIPVHWEMSMHITVIGSILFGYGVVLMAVSGGRTRTVVIEKGEDEG